MLKSEHIMQAEEVASLLGVTVPALRNYRAESWDKGIHYVQPRQKSLYIRPMILSWIQYSGTDPMRHQRDKELWLAGEWKD